MGQFSKTVFTFLSPSLTCLWSQAEFHFKLCSFSLTNQWDVGTVFPFSALDL